MSKAFSFGKNWLDFVNHSLDRERMDIAKDSLLHYLPQQAYQNKLFIDAGCGSGIFSLSALRLGCKQAISFDYDEFSVLATRTMKSKFYSLAPENASWDIFQGSILDAELVHRLKSQGDIVYSWGVLHHTGDMYRAISNAAKLVKPEGYFIISIYNKAPFSDLWLKIKKMYNMLPAPMKRLFIFTVLLWIRLERLLLMMKSALTRKKPPNFHASDDFRGMDLYYNIIDWLGGYPYEFASFEEIKQFVEQRGFQLIQAPTKWPSPTKEEYKKDFSFFGRFFYSYISNYTGTNEFVFKRDSYREASTV